MSDSVIVSQRAEVGEDVELGEGTRVWQFATICDRARIGKWCVIGSCAWIGKDVVMGDDCRLQHGVFIPNGTQIGNQVFIGPNVTLTDDKYPRVNNPNYHADPPVIEDNVSIGAGAVILPGVRLRAGTMVGAGAIVTVETAPGVLVRNMMGAISAGPAPGR